ncbi:biliverdin-producing heme oxygenase [Alteromonas sp. 009811495]|uniref:biliverdin-producing heme oxygenase n=1 Tax=Alteromonas sp. 009811495 TaxID=3002962 RepID=UPI00237EBD83|nr:biliverdin-producing heme oxygenase [Alteromonas sp. 009811495]WDT87719.1 biliverdin-producing heme oxygenase [Alteromonas sp. 009811495]
MHNIFSALKQGTQANHTILENTHPFSLYHQTSSFDVTVYEEVLSVMYWFHSAVAGALQESAKRNSDLLPLLTHINIDSVLDALNSDLAQLRANSVSNDVTLSTLSTSKDESPSLVDLPSFYSDSSRTISALYVWLGSSMGANIIVRRLATISPAPPTHYYAAMSQCGRAWVTFKQHVETLIPSLSTGTPQLARHIVEDANSWFAYLIALGEAKQSTSLPVQAQKA